MKNTEWMAFALTLALSAATLSPAVYAEPAATEAAAETAEQEETEMTEQAARAGKKNEKKKESKQKVEEPENAIGKDAAAEKALADAGVTAEQVGKVRSRVSQLDDGTVIYKVRFTCDGQKYSYQINAISGEVVEKSTEAVTEKTTDTTSKAVRHSRKKAGKQKAADQQKNAAPENAAENSGASDGASDQNNA